MLGCRCCGGRVAAELSFPWLGLCSSVPDPSCPVLFRCLGVETAVGDPSGEVERLEAAAKAREEAEEEADYRAVERGHVRYAETRSREERREEKREVKRQTGGGKKTPTKSKSRPLLYVTNPLHHPRAERILLVAHEKRPLPYHIIQQAARYPCSFSMRTARTCVFVFLLFFS